MRLRKSLHEAVQNPVRDGAGRSAAIDISTLIAYRDASQNSSDYQLLLRRRGKKGVPLRAGLLHVVPGFMFQPTVTTNFSNEFSITHNVYREYLEEIFSVPEMELLPENTHWNQFYSDVRLQYLMSLISEGSAKLYFTGVAINLMNLRPEVCTLLVIDNPEWYKRCQGKSEYGWKFNSEFANKKDKLVSGSKLVSSLTLAEDNEMFKTGNLDPHEMVPAGAAAFWLGVDVLQKIKDR